ncbi:MAG: SPOR domain-containing protein [Candidatus Omnitrophota bacterium]
MTDANFQNDFFGEQFHAKKGRKSRLLSRYSQQRFLPHIRIPVEHTVILAIGVLILIIISYAVGVERGKRMPPAKLVIARETASVALEEKEVAKAPQPAPDKDMPELRQQFKAEPEADRLGSDIDVAGEQAQIEIKTDTSVSAGTVYIVQLASFKDRYSANKEINKLKEKGVEAHFTKKGQWYQVYATGYRTIDEAKKAREKLITDYEDCYIRKTE